MAKQTQSKEVRTRQRFPKGEKAVIEKISVSQSVSAEIERRSEANGDSKSAFMGRIIREWLADQKRTKK